MRLQREERLPLWGHHREPRGKEDLTIQTNNINID